MKRAHIDRLRSALATLDSVMEECEATDLSAEFVELQIARDTLAEAIDHNDEDAE